MKIVVGRVTLARGPRAEMRVRSRRLILLVALLLAGAVVLDGSRAPEQQVTAAIAIGTVHAYQRTISPLLERWGVGCRFTPTCSRYAEAVLRKHGIARGTWLAVKRVARCGPWTAAATVDPAE